MLTEPLRAAERAALRAELAATRAQHLAVLSLSPDALERLLDALAAAETLIHERLPTDVPYAVCALCGMMNGHSPTCWKTRARAALAPVPAEGAA